MHLGNVRRYRIRSYKIYKGSAIHGQKFTWDFHRNRHKTQNLVTLNYTIHSTSGIRLDPDPEQKVDAIVTHGGFFVVFSLNTFC